MTKDAARRSTESPPRSWSTDSPDTVRATCCASGTTSTTTRGPGWSRIWSGSTWSGSTGSSRRWSTARGRNRQATRGSSRSPSIACPTPTPSGSRAGQAAELGEAALAAGEVAVVVVAGGQGTRLGFDGPKGTFPIGPVSEASLFQIHAEKVLALSRRHERAIPLYVMTSPENHDDTLAFFAAHGNFGLAHVRFFPRAGCPPWIAETGKILLAEPGRVALSPDGHGGTLAALARPGPDGGAELPRRDARGVASGRSSTSRSTTPW